MPAAPPIPRDLRETAALREMVIGSIGLLCGGAIVLWAAYGLGAPLPLETGARRWVALALGACIAVLGGVTFVRGLAGRGKLRPGADGLSIALVAVVTVPLAALALGGYRHTHPPQVPDKQVRGQPYTFSYPGDWKRNSHMEVVATYRNVGHVTALGARTTADPGQGVLVIAFVPESRAAMEEWVRKTSPGVHIAAERPIELDGEPGIMVDYARPEGEVFQSQAGVLHDGVAYVVSCFVTMNPGEARDACRKVIDTFRFREQGVPGKAARDA
jgi:hypothetical protein